MLAAVFVATLCAASGLSNDAAEAKANPVNKVVTVLEEMKAQLEKEAGQDDEIMAKMVCWCETNDKLKTKAIKDAKATIGQLEEFVPEGAAKIATLQAEVKGLNSDIASGKEELAEATGIRQKESGEFSEEEKDQMTSIAGLTKAISALGAKMSFLQVQGQMNQKQQHEVKAFLKTQGKAHAPSSEILGVLKSMKESFEISLKDSQEDEKQAVAAYADLKAGKDDEIAAATEQRDTKEALAADTVEKLAQAKEDLVTTKENLASDEKFLADLKEKCSNMDAEFAARKKMRTEEMAAVGEALAILTEDDARDQFSKSVAFTQVSMKMHKRVMLHGVTAETEDKKIVIKRARVRAARLLLAMAMDIGSPRLSELAVSMRSDVFVKIKKAIDDMVAQLKVENKEEIKHRDYCIAELNQNEKQTDEAYDKKKELTIKTDDLSLAITNLGEEIADEKQQIVDTQIQMKKASENREGENFDFQNTIADQKATKVILNKALDKLKSFYAKAALLQKQEPAPEGFGGEYKKSGGAQGVMMMIETIIEEADTVMADATKAEQDAQTAYEAFMKDSTKAIEGLNESVSEKTANVADSKAELARTGADFKDTMTMIEELATYQGELHAQCDFVLKQFDVRQEARAKEMEALTEAKMILSGMEV